MTEQQEQLAETRDGEAPPVPAAVPAGYDVEAPAPPSQPTPATAEKAERPRFFKVYTLSEEAQSIIRDRLERHRSVPQIRREVEQLTGEHITHGSLARYATHYRRKLAKREQICENLRAGLQVLRERGLELSAEAQARLLEVFIQAANENKLAELGPYAAGKLALAFADSDRKERELELRGEMEHRKVAVLERRLALIVEKARPALPAAGQGGGGQAISPAEAIKEIFGVANEK